MEKEAVCDPEKISGGQFFPLLRMSREEHGERRLVIPEFLRNPPGAPRVADRGVLPESKLPHSRDQPFPEIHILHARIWEPFIEPAQGREKLPLNREIARPQKSSHLVLWRALGE